MTAPLPDEPAGPGQSRVPDTVVGERGASLANAVRSVQSRVSSVAAAALMITLGLSALSWYYAHALGRPGHARQIAQTAAGARAQGEMPLPSLGPIAPPATAAASALPVEPAPAASLPSDLPLDEARARTPPWNPASAGADAVEPRVRAPAEVAFERRLSGLVFAREAQSPAAGPAISTPAGSALPAAPVPTEPVRADAASARKPGDPNAGMLAPLLRPSVTVAAQAEILPSRRFLLPKGAFIDCTLETAIDSTLPGMTTCITAADTFSADGKVVLLERGTKLVGETRGQVQQGQARVFVVWAQARTPAGVVVSLDSPGTDELGRSGLPGEVHHHFWQRFGAAMLISLVDGAVQAGVQASSRSSGAVIYTPSGSTDVLTEVLKDTLQIPPTVVKRNGERIQVLVARDLDFRSVYELRASVH